MLTKAERNRIWKAALKCIEAIEIDEATVRLMGIMRGKVAWPAAAYAAMCTIAIREAARKARQP
jgi:hypothetical protein